MNRAELTSSFQRFERQIRLLESSSTDTDAELIALAANQVCVAICGDLEQNLRRVLTEYTRQRSAPGIDKAVSKLCDGYQNPKIAKVIELVGLFDAKFADDLRTRKSARKTLSSA